MEKISINTKAAQHYRKASKLSQDEVGERLGRSRRIVADVENPRVDVKFSDWDLHNYAEIIGIDAPLLWAQIPSSARFYGTKITTGEELARTILMSDDLDQFEALSLPQENSQAGAMIEIAAAFDKAKSMSKEERLEEKTKSAAAFLERAISLRNLFHSLADEGSEPSEGDNTDIAWPLSTQFETFNFRVIRTYQLTNLSEKGFIWHCQTSLVMDRSDDRNGGERFFIEKAVFDWKIRHPKSGEAIFDAQHPVFVMSENGQGLKQQALPEDLERWALSVMPEPFKDPLTRIRVI